MTDRCGKSVEYKYNSLHNHVIAFGLLLCNLRCYDFDRKKQKGDDKNGFVR